MNDKPDKSLKTIKAILVALLIIVLLVLSKAAVNVSIRILLSFFVFLLVLVKLFKYCSNLCRNQHIINIVSK